MILQLVTYGVGFIVVPGTSLIFSYPSATSYATTTTRIIGGTFT